MLSVCKFVGIRVHLATLCVCVSQRAKDMVMELLAEKDMQAPGGGGMGFNNFDGPMGHGGPGGMEVGCVCSCGWARLEIAVPVGWVLNTNN